MDSCAVVLSTSITPTQPRGGEKNNIENRPEQSKWVVFYVTFYLIWCREKVSWWRVKQHSTAPCPDLNKQVYIPLETHGEDVNFLHPELCVNDKLRARVKSTTWLSAARFSLACPTYMCAQTKCTLKTHVSSSQWSSVRFSCLRLSAGQYVSQEPLFSQLCADILCTCVIDNKGMSSRPARGQGFTRRTISDAPLYCLFSTLGPRASSTAFSFVWRNSE